MAQQPRYDIAPKIKNEFAIFDQSSTTEDEQKNGLTLDYLSMPEACNETSFALPKQGYSLLVSCINQVSYNSLDEFESDLEDAEVDSLQLPPHAKTFQEDDFALRISSAQRHSFAQKHLFRRGRDAISEASSEDEESDDDSYQGSSPQTPIGEIGTPSSDFDHENSASA